MKKTKSIFRRWSLRSLSIVLMSATAAFGLGIQTAGDLDPVIGSIRAGSALIEGDLDGSGALDVNDAIAALEIALEYRTPTPEELDADPNGDFRILAEDALAILDALSRVASIR